MTVPSFPGLKSAPTLQETAHVVNNLLRGKMNVVTTVTLNAGAATTTFGNNLLGPTSFVGFMPTTANARTEGTPYVTGQDKGTCVLNHANNAQTDRTYTVVVIG